MLSLLPRCHEACPPCVSGVKRQLQELAKQKADTDRPAAAANKEAICDLDEETNLNKKPKTDLACCTNKSALLTSGSEDSESEEEEEEEDEQESASSSSSSSSEDSDDDNEKEPGESCSSSEDSE